MIKDIFNELWTKQKKLLKNYLFQNLEIEKNQKHGWKNEPDKKVQPSKVDSDIDGVGE